MSSADVATTMVVMGGGNSSSVVVGPTKEEVRTVMTGARDTCKAVAPARPNAAASNARPTAATKAPVPLPYRTTANSINESQSFRAHQLDDPTSTPTSFVSLHSEGAVQTSSSSSMTRPPISNNTSISPSGDVRPKSPIAAVTNPSSNNPSSNNPSSNNPSSNNSPKHNLTTISSSPQRSQEAEATGSINSNHRSTSAQNSPLQLQQQQRFTLDSPRSRLRAASNDPVEREQILFEQRLCEDPFGVAVRKINQHGKSNLRYVRCIYLASNSGGSNNSNNGEKRRVLIWGRKKDVQIPLDRFVCVRKGKTTDRARKNGSPASRIMSLIIDDLNHTSLDIEAPTRLDRDKFARAFSKFLNVPLEADNNNANSSVNESSSIHSADVRQVISVQKESVPSSSRSLPGNDKPHETSPAERQSSEATNPSTTATEELVNTTVAAQDGAEKITTTTTSLLPCLPLATPSCEKKSVMTSSLHTPLPQSNSQEGDVNQSITNIEAQDDAVVSTKPRAGRSDQNDDAGSDVSSLTGHGYDQELVEELHMAINELRAELEESRAEAARAVKVAEQAIQSAEKSSSQEWQNTVTHKAAEAAAMAQKRSAEAMAKQRLAEERLEGERKTALFWRKQAEQAEEEAGKLQTRAAAAEVQRAAMEDQLASQRRLALSQIDILRCRAEAADKQHREMLEAAFEKNRVLSVELDVLRRELQAVKEAEENHENASFSGRPGSLRKKLLFGRKKANPAMTESRLIQNSGSSSSSLGPKPAGGPLSPNEVVSCEQLVKIRAESVLLRKQLEILRKTTEAEMAQLPKSAEIWAAQVGEVVKTSQSEVSRLRDRLAAESAARRKLQHEVQDLKGAVRVYCRPRPMPQGDLSKSPTPPLFSFPSQNNLVVHRERFCEGQEGPMSFEFERIFEPDSSQQEVYTEIEDICLSVLDGYNVCIMAYGQTDSGKTHSMLGDIKFQGLSAEIHNSGIILRTLQQLYAVLGHREERFKDTFTISILEVYNERLCDLLAGTQSGETKGKALAVEKLRRKGSTRDDDGTSVGQRNKLEIRCNVHGETVVQGLLSVEVTSMEQARELFEECLELRAARLEEQGIEKRQYDASSHFMVTVNVTSMNIATGLGVVGKIQFVDLAGADLVPRRPTAGSAPMPLTGVGSKHEWRFANRSLETLNEVVEAQTRFAHNVPYRNSTLTHLLRDCLHGDAKVVCLACVASDPRSIEETVATLRFASQLRRVTVGKATQHVWSSP